jgi:hypothetical protein
LKGENFRTSIEDMGSSQKTLELEMAAGMVTSDNGVFVTSFSGVHEAEIDLGIVRRNIVSSPLFNALHSISRTQRGYLVASTGLDLLLEFNRAELDFDPEWRLYETHVL